MLSKKAIKVICIILAALMALSTLAVVIQILAVDESAVAAAVVMTGDNDWDYLLPIIIIGVAVLAILAAVLIPKFAKRKNIGKPEPLTEEKEEQPAEE